ncbi:MAG: L-glutamate gamma-semialdehyde dehydrogenase [Candidatus Palauibacterales bacterium]|nr:L-glutamate gamma-semialdehyde dehydrogenase [Candidatus Palauibacterales bacterium]MDP2529763.1 L-glutamate gamma-semialdehyde dehydrogenase [Candidatus Palauibacterales bacterium]MDP2585118.1 L-glutamate gamma-semialdehyde dehydrogenase [Candidatus Palauibacterales bacterium]
MESGTVASGVGAGRSGPQRPAGESARATAAASGVTGLLRVPVPVNEPVRSYAPGSPEREELKSRLAEMAESEADIPIVIGGEEIRTGDTGQVVMPHDHQHVLARFHRAGADEARAAIEAARAAWSEWSAWDWQERAAVFLRAADLLAGPWRATVNAATMLGQSKTAHQAEIDSACELVDFWRFNARFAAEIYENQPSSSPGMWNQTDYRPLEGFVLAINPFNFTSIAGNLPTAPALMGNVVIWKPATVSLLSSYYVMRVLQEAGLPAGVINFVPGPSRVVTGPLFESPALAGIHFTGSTGVFQTLWKNVSDNLENYRTYPRVVGETGGKDFIVAHESADPAALAVAIARGGFEYQGQKCSAVSRVYVPDTLWDDVRERVLAIMEDIEVGDPTDFRIFMGAVIDEEAYDKITSYIEYARESDDLEILSGGGASDVEGWFIQPTLILSKDPRSRLMCEEIFGPVVTLHVYDADRWTETLERVDDTSPYGLTGAVFARDRAAVREALSRLRNAAGNFYVNDKPTGAVVGQQPFGGARASGTNDKAGSRLNLLRWVSPRSIKETFAPPTDWRYPFMKEK